MNTTKQTLQVISLALLLWLLTGCGSNPPGEPASMPSPASLPTTEPAIIPSPSPLPATAPAASGVITGRVHLVSPPTPRMFVYAVDPGTGNWVFTETEPSNGEAVFTLVAPPGNYQVFAFSENSGYAGYSLDGWTLAFVTLAANQTVADVVVGPPGQSACGSMFGAPASPDGRFAAAPGPDEACKASLLTPAATTGTWQTIQAGRIQFQQNATSWYTQGDLSPNTALRFVLMATKGQQMTIRLFTEPPSGDFPYATLKITGANGQLLTYDVNTYWSNVLASSQDYYIEVHSLAQQQIHYTLIVDIPAEILDPNLGEEYEPVSPSVCQTIQEAATQALGVNFTLETRAPFIDTLAGEAGQGCRLTASGNGYNFSSPQAAVETLVNSAGLGWTRLTNYQADGPQGTFTGLTRDMGLMLIKAEWEPAMGVQCPPDQPITLCNLAPEQRIYTIQIDIAQHR